jgi:hypothetical protein
MNRVYVDVAKHSSRVWRIFFAAVLLYLVVFPMLTCQ